MQFDSAPVQRECGIKSLSNNMFDVLTAIPFEICEKFMHAYVDLHCQPYTNYDKTAFKHYILNYGDN